MSEADSGDPILCYDGSAEARHAIAEAAELLGPRPALVVHVWEGLPAVPGVEYSGEVQDALRRRGEELAAEGANAARNAGFEASPLAIEAAGPVWSTLLELIDERRPVAVIVGSRGLTGARSVLLGSVSGKLVHESSRPILTVPPPDR